MTAYEYKYLEQNPLGSQEELLLYYIYLSQEKLATSFTEFFRTNLGWSTSQTRVMCHLKFYRLISMSELATLTNTSRQHMTQIIDALVKAGLAERRQDPEDRRAVYVQPTVTGMKQLDTGERRYISYLTRSISKLPEDQQEKTVDAIRTVSRFLSGFKLEKENDGGIIF